MSTSTKYVATIGNGSSTVYAVTHSLNNLDVMVQLYDVATGETVYTSVERDTNNIVNITFASAPSLNSIRVMVLSI